jgi:hypothetical protein
MNFEKAFRIVEVPKSNRGGAGRIDDDLIKIYRKKSTKGITCRISFGQKQQLKEFKTVSLAVSDYTGDVALVFSEGNDGQARINETGNGKSLSVAQVPFIEKALDVLKLPKNEYVNSFLTFEEILPKVFLIKKVNVVD